MLMQFIQTISERSASEGNREENIFLKYKSGAKPVMWTGKPAKYAVWKAKLVANFRMMGGKRVDKWAHV